MPDDPILCGRLARKGADGGGIGLGNRDFDRERIITEPNHAIDCVSVRMSHF
jgi:hypothetical protein